MDLKTRQNKVINNVPLQAPGHMGVDYESRVDFDRLRKYRIGRAKESLNKTNEKQIEDE
jgi:hypothetical protein